MNWRALLFWRKRPLIRPRRYAQQVHRCLAAAERITGLPCRGLERVTVVPCGTMRFSYSLQCAVAILPGTNHCGEWLPGSIRVACSDVTGSVRDEVLIHEIAHQIEREAGKARLGIIHCPEFVGKVWGWS